MKGLIALLALTIAVSSPAQLVQEDTPPTFGTFFQEYGGDGSVYTLTSIAGRQSYFALPFGLDFAGGFNVLVGKRTRSMGDLLTEVPAYGIEAYGLRYIGGDGAYVRVGVRFLMDGDDNSGNRGAQRGRVTGTLAIGFNLGG